MNKKEMIDKFKSLEGKVITVNTSEKYVVGHFSPTFDTRTYYMKAKCTQLRKIIRVSSSMMKTLVIKESIVGYTSREDYAEDWFSMFTNSLRFSENATEEQKEYTLKRLREQFDIQLSDGTMFSDRDEIRCDFPKASEITFSNDFVSMYDNMYSLKEYEGGNIND